MLTKQDFILRYEALSDFELYGIYIQKFDYSPEAQEAVIHVIGERGGAEQVLARVKEEDNRVAEATRIASMTAMMSHKEFDDELIQKKMSSTVLSPEEVRGIVDQTLAQTAVEKQDRSIGTRTVIGSLLAIPIAGVAGSILFGLQLSYAPTIDLKIILILYFGVLLICYGIVRLFTRQSKRNRVVILATALSFVLAFLIGDWLVPLFLALHL
ncbi:hypothetical protein [Puia dinghuensis]|uniref:Uncharacterized protein n=1 Tax=Puia dinghuensis TaxID=1792502 RepID=A0A8J2XTI7_9BACT|nr:hypothetical protein [Puia dinghuensis]GGB03772.1 hypothetical protein GCM10011511_28860 [Puia dinghuensis]